ncbi:hypothetical protein KP509_36G055500 [Ceratopteris richardii]|uniref:C2 domain-containing protein n=1 Tax=Ceratopteris richardii TaxID=49495 RepID=A0A8T2QEK6_CERRI|nr:hypothetical protein KP509_36G055500 [Ceratopteris richardii]
MSLLGHVEVFLIGGKDMKKVDFLGKNDPYAIISYKTQDQKSKSLEGAGSDPVWKQKFYFEVDEDIADVVIRVFDEDRHTADDFIGETRIPLARVLEESEVPAQFYDLVRKSGRTHGQVEVALKFTPLEKRPVQQPGTHQNGQHSTKHHHIDGPYGDNNPGGWR